MSWARNLPKTQICFQRSRRLSHVWILHIKHERTQPIVGKDDPGKKARIERATRDFAFFCSYYLPTAFPLPFGEYQKTVIDIVNARSVRVRAHKGP